MSDINTADYRGRFEFVEFGHDVPEGDFARFVVVFIENLLKTFELDNEIFPSSKNRKKGYSLKKMSSLIYYAYARGFTKASVIADMAKYHSHFKFVANGITPDEDTINNFINIHGSFFEYFVSYTVKFADVNNFTTFENIGIDSTVTKSANNKFNVVHEDDVEVLIRYFSSLNVSNEEVSSLRYPAKKFLMRHDITNKRKLKELNEILKRFEETGANTVPVNDKDSIHLKNKQGNSDVGYVIQTAVDNQSKLFLKLIVTQKATDHNQFPYVINKVLENIGLMPGVVCSDSNYNTRDTLEFIEETGLNALIDNNRSAKIRNGHKSDNKFHKDNMDYDQEEDCFICYNQKKLIYQGTKVRWVEKNKNYKIEREYYNKEACLNCKYSDECCKTKYRIVKVSGGKLALDMESKFRDYLNILKYILRFSTVEAPNGTLKVFYHINEFLSNTLIKMQNRINICGGSYNLKRLYNDLMKMGGIDSSNIIDIVKKLCENTNPFMFLSKLNKLPFLDDPLLLPHKCESIIMKELEEKNRNNTQTTLECTFA